jgi:hypothetical protein
MRQDPVVVIETQADDLRRLEAPHLLQRQARGISRQPDRCDRRRRNDPVRACAARSEHRHHLRQFEPGEGSGERAHKTLQDRLVKELRLTGAATLAAGNALLPAFTADYNTRFAKLPANKKDLHRPLRAADDLEDAFAWKEERTLSQALTLQYDKVIFILEPSERAKAAIGKRVTVVNYPDGRLALRHNGVESAYRTFDKIRQVDQAAVADNKRRGPILAMIRDEQLSRGPERRSMKAPRRRDQRDARLFKASRSAELVYEPSELALARSNNGCGCELRPIGRRSGAALRRGSAPARRPNPVTFLDQALEPGRNHSPDEQDDIAALLRLTGADDEPPVSLTPGEQTAITVSKAAAARSEFANDEQGAGGVGQTRSVRLRYIPFRLLPTLARILDYIAAHAPQSARRVQARIQALPDLLCCISTLAAARLIRRSAA